MSKPTLVQKALNRPSQTYGNLDTRPKKDYYSTKQDMIRIAAAAASSNTHTTASTKLARALYYPSPQYHVDDDDEDDGDSDLEVFFTPNTSPRTSMASSAATVTFGGGATRKPSRRSLTNVTSAESHLPMVLPLPEQSTSTTKSQILTESQTSSSVPSTRTPSRSASTSTRTPSTTSPSATVSRSASTSTQTRNRHAALSSTSSLSSTSLDGHSLISSEGAEILVDQSATPKAKDKERERSSHTTPTSQRRDEQKDRRQAASTSTSASTATRPRTVGVGSTTTTTIVIGSSRDPQSHGKGKERERERSFASASPSASTTTPIPSTTSSSSTSASTKYNSISYTNSGTSSSTEPGTGTISISSRTKYVPPANTGASGGRNGSSKPPHTFSAFAAIGSSSNSSPATSTPGSSVSHDHDQTSRSTSTPTSSPSTSTPSSHTLSRKGHIQIGEKQAGESAFSTKTPKSAASATSPKGRTNSSVHASPSTKTSINSSKTSTPSKLPIPADANGGQGANKNKSAPSSTRSPDANGHARSPSTSSPPSSFPHTSMVSSSSTSPSTVHRKAPPPVLPPLPMTPPQNNPTPIQKPGSGQSGLMAMFNMDALMEEEEEEEDLYEDEDDPDGEEGRSTPRMYNRGKQRAFGSSSSNSPSTRASTSGGGDGSTSTSGHARRAPPKTLSAEVTSLQQTFTSPGERPSKGTQGYTSLVLPRAPPPSSSNMYLNGIGGKHPKMQVNAIRDGTSGKVDLTKSGVAQTTMASVEVVRGLGERARGKGVFGLLRFGFGGGGKARDKERPRGPMPVHIPTMNGSAQGDSAVNTTIDTTSITPLGFTAYREPPSYVPSGSVLVQVWAVGVDGVDGRLVGVKFGDGKGPEEALHNGGNETEEETEGEGEGNETEVETETDREGRLPQSSTDDEDWEDNLMSTQSTPARPTQPKVGGIAPRMSPEHAKKGRLAALGRSFSLRIAKGANNDNDKAAVHRSASAAVPSFKNRADVNGVANESPSSHKKALSFSLKRSNTAVSRATNGTGGSSEKNVSGTTQPRTNSKKRKLPKQSQAAVGYIPGRSFVGRVLECGWEVRDEVVRKGEWVVGLLDVRKGGALAEFIVVDRHRVHRVPHPQTGPASSPVWAMSPPVPPSSPSSPYSPQVNGAQSDPPTQTLTLEELALLPLCGLPAYRAVRTIAFAFSSGRDGGTSAIDRKSLDFVGGNYAHGHGVGAKQSSVDANKNDDMMTDHGHDPRHGYRRRALVLRGHDGVGAMAVQMLARRGWLVSVHVPCSALRHGASQEEIDRFMQVTEERARIWGADEIIHDDSNPMGGVPASSAGAVNGNGEWDSGADDGRGAAVRLIDMIAEDGDVFDAVFDTVGGKDVREAAERLLRFQGPVGGVNGAAVAVTRNGIPVFKRRGVGQFTTTVGDVPERVIPSAGDNFRAGLRSLRLGGTTAHTNTPSYANEPTTPGVEDGPTTRISADGKAKGKVGYAWVSVAQDVDWEGDDVSDTLGAVVRMALEDGVRPVVEDIRDHGDGAEDGKDLGPSRVVPFERAPKVFVDNGPLRDGGTIVVKIADS